MADYKALMQRLGYVFKDEGLLKLALTHRSVRGDNNERLEFLGDAALSIIIAEELFKRHPQAQEGDLSRQRSALVNGELLAELALELQLDKVIGLGQGEKKSGGSQRPSILADAFEAIIAAIYLEAGQAAARECILRCYGARLDNDVLLVSEKDPKSLLQEFLQARAMTLPHYVAKTSGKSHQQVFTVTCHVESFDFTTTASSSNRRKAEQLAAAEFLEYLHER